MRNYTNILPMGKRNAISTEELRQILGFSTTRCLQLDIAEARAAGVPILSATSGGYYLPQSTAEVVECQRTLRARAISTLKTLKNLNQYALDMDADYKQLSINDIFAEV